MIIVIPALLALYLVALTIGLSIGAKRRRDTIKKSLKDRILIAEYSLEYELSPLEFELLYLGSISRRGVAGLISQAIMSGQAVVKDDQSIEIRPLGHNEKRIFTTIQDGVVRNSIQALTALTLNSLTHKGWISNLDPRDEKINMSYRHEIKSLLVMVVGLVISCSAVFMITQGPGIVQSISIAVALAGLATITYALFKIFFVRVIDISAQSSSQISKRITPKFRNKYRDIHGLFTYIQVSDMDTMTPDYDSLDLKGLDRLYPYAVASGLDKKIVKLLLNRKVIIK